MSAPDLSRWFAERESWKEGVWGTCFDAAPTASTTPCPSIPCPDFGEETLDVRPYLEIAERSPDRYWVRCLTCHSWVAPAEGGSRAEVLEHAEEIHECVVMGR